MTSQQVATTNAPPVAPAAVEPRWPVATPTVDGGSGDASGIRNPASSIPTMTPNATLTSRNPTGNRCNSVLPLPCPRHTESGPLWAIYGKM